MDKTFIIFNIYELYRLRTRYIIKHMQDTLGEQDTELYFLTNALACTLMYRYELQRSESVPVLH